MLINVTGTTFDKEIVENSGTTGETKYVPRFGYALGELGEDMTGLEIRDMRSWQQTPVLNVKSFISAITDTNKNGGWTVNLDPEFFTSGNPYYEQAWITLPAISDLEYAGYDLHEGGFVIGSPSWNEWKGLYIVSATGNMDTEKLNCPVINVSLVLLGYGGIFNDSIYLSTQYESWAQTHNYVHQAYQNFFIQLVAYDVNNRVVAASNVLNLTTPKAGEYYTLSHYTTKGLYTPDGGVTREKVILGQFDRQTNNDFKFTSSEGTGFDLSLGQNVSYSYLRIKITKVGWGRKKRTGNAWIDETVNLNEYYLHDGDASHNRGLVSASTQYTVLSVNTSEAQYPTGEQIASNAIIKKDKLLKSDFTPAEYLIGYTKVFGLYYDVHIDSKTVDIKLRDNYYDGKVEDINESIDRDKEIRITPLSFDKKFYDLKYKEDNKSQFLEQYSETYSKTYGQQVINTNYEFNNEHKNLLDNIPYQSAVECLEKSKYYRDLYTRRLSRPIWTIMPWEYTLWAWDNDEETYNTTSKEMPAVSPTHATYWNSMEGYDIFPKIQFRDDGNDPVDTKNVLVFFNGFRGLQNSSGGTIPMWLTDDNSAMLEINDGKPCWLYTELENDVNGTPIATKITQLPVFGRYIHGNNDSIQFSWDFGEPLELYNPTLSTSPETTIYNQYWKTYIEDLYSVNTRVVTAYVRFKTPLSKENLKHFYWFDNAYWVINKIIDYNPDNSVTKIEFVKVNNPEAYTDGLIIDTNDYLIVNPTSLSFSTIRTGITHIQTNLRWGAYIVYGDDTAQTFNASISSQQFDLNGGSAIITINADTGLSWTISGESWMTLTRTGGTGNATVTLTIPSTSSTRSGNIVVSGSNGSAYTWTITQSVSSVSIIPTGATQTIPEHSSGVVYTQSFQSNVPFTVTSSESWLSASTSNSVVSFCATSNNEGQAPRVGYVYLKYNNTTYATITATQMTESVEYYALFDNNTTSYTYTFASGVVDTYTGVNVSSNCQYTVRANNDWLSARTTASGIEFCCLSENQTGQERSGTVSVLYEGAVLAVATINQQQEPEVIPFIQPAINLVEFGYSEGGYSGETVVINATSGLSWTASTTSGFGLTLYPDVQIGTGQVKVLPTVITGDTDLTGTINITGESGTSASIDLIRYRPSVMISESAYTADCHSTAFTIDITALTDFTIVSGDDSWLVPSISSGTTGVSSVTITVAKNLDTHDKHYRTGNIWFYATYLGSTTQVNCTVQQNDMNLDATLNITSFPIYSGVVTLTITTDIDWEVTVPSWMSLPQDLIGSSGHGSTAFTIEYSSTTSTRQGSVYVYDASDHDFYVKIDVEQPYVTVDVYYNIDWSYNGNDSKPKFKRDGNSAVTSVSFNLVTINWTEVDAGAYGSEFNYRFELWGYNSNYSQSEQIGSAILVDSQLWTPVTSGSDTYYTLDGVEISGFGESQYTNYELRTTLERKDGSAGLSDGGAIVNYHYSGGNYSSVFDPSVGIARYKITAPDYAEFSTGRTSSGNIMYSTANSGFNPTIKFVLNSDAYNCDFKLRVTLYGRNNLSSSWSYLGAENLVETTPFIVEQTYKTANGEFVCYGKVYIGSNSSTYNKYRRWNVTLVEVSGATSSTGKHVLFIEDNNI